MQNGKSQDRLVDTYSQGLSDVFGHGCHTIFDSEADIPECRLKLCENRSGISTTTLDIVDDEWGVLFRIIFIICIRRHGSSGAFDSLHTEL